mgnify:CR=1 FL=1
MYTYAVPQVDRVSFVSLVQTEALHAEVVHTSQLRARVEQCLHSREPLAIVQAVSEYLPYLMGLYDSVQQDTILLRDDVQLTWRSMLVSGKFRLQGLLSEVCLMHMLYASSLRAEAATIVDALGAYELGASDRKACDDRVRVAIDLLCRASGVCEYVATQLLPTYPAPPYKSAYPPELVSEGVQACSKLAMADAHALAIRKLLAPYARQHGPPLPPQHPSPSLLAKLHLHTATLFVEAHTLAAQSLGMVLHSARHKLAQKLHTLRPDADADDKMAFLQYARRSAHVHKALAFQWLGIDHGEHAKDTGWAIAYLEMALSMFEGHKKSQAWAHMSRWHAAYKKMNDTLTFQRIPSVQEVQLYTSEGRAAMFPKAYTPVYAFGAKQQATHRTTYAGAGAYY